MRIGGRGRWTVRGRITASRRLNSSAWRVTRSSVQSRVRISRFRSKSRPRCLKGTPTASNSRAYQPAATPRISRPLETASSVPSAFAATVGFRSGNTITPVPSLILRVRAAIAVRVPTASRIGNAGSTPRITWSHAHSDSKPSASARSAYAISASTSGVSVGPTKFLIASPKSTRRGASFVRISLSEEAAIRIERTEHRQLIRRGRLGRRDLRRLEQVEAGVLADPVDRGARMYGLDPHATGHGIEAEGAERGDHAGDAAEEQAAALARAVAGQPAGARHEVDLRDEAPLLVRGHDDNLAAQRGDVVGAAGAGQPHLRLPVVAAQHRRVDVA